jgi:uncharacterized membrane protein
LPCEDVASELLIQILAFGHVLSAIGWLGGGLLTAFAIGPNLRKMSPGSNLEFDAKVFPPVLRFLQVTIGSTLVFGILLLYFFTDGNFTWLSNTTRGYELSAGILLAVVTAVVAMGVTIPSFKKISKIASSLLESADKTPPPEMAKFGMRAKRASQGTVGLLLVVLALMIAAGF